VSDVSIDYDDSQEAAKAVRDGLTAFNRHAADLPEPLPVNVIVRDADGAIKGGVVGRFAIDTVYIDLVWLDDSLKGKGVGRTMMGKAEDRARALGATIAWLYTMSWQARPFYEHLDYKLLAEMPYANGRHRRYFMWKDL